jgi:hypothetical protein
MGPEHRRRNSILVTRKLFIASFAFLLVANMLHTSAAAPRFYQDDPLWEEPNSQDASHVQPWTIDLAWDLVQNLFSRPGDSATDVRAMNVNSVDEVPNGAWFTNRQALSVSDVGRGAATGSGPATGHWTVISAKGDGITPGFTVRDRDTHVWFIKFDPPGYRGMATGTEVVVSRLFWALGYHTPEYYIAKLREEDLEIAEGTHITPPGGKQRAMVRDDLEWLLSKADRDPDGSFRVIASKALPGKALGGFRFYGTRPDDPNDIVPHEHRRELRGYGVFAAWFNHVDAKSINSLDVLLDEKPRNYVRHYLLDFGSTIGSAAVGPREYWEGREYLVEPGNLGKGILGLGFYRLGERMTPMTKTPSIGRIDRDDSKWDPETWKPRAPNPAFIRARADDKFWAARRAATISDAMLRAAVDAGQFGDAEGEAALVRMLRQRRDAILRTYLPAINPVTDVALDGSGRLTFTNAAVDARVAKPPSAYRVSWAVFDNSTGEARSIGESKSQSNAIQAPAGLPSTRDAYLRVEISAIDAPIATWNTPVSAYFRRSASGWALVGFERR